LGLPVAIVAMPVRFSIGFMGNQYIGAVVRDASASSFSGLTGESGLRIDCWSFRSRISRLEPRDNRGSATVRRFFGVTGHLPGLDAIEKVRILTQRKREDMKVTE
jgi:hypothetical protein